MKVRGPGETAILILTDFGTTTERCPGKYGKGPKLELPVQGEFFLTSKGKNGILYVFVILQRLSAGNPNAKMFQTFTGNKG